MATPQFVEDRLTKALHRHKANILYMIGNVENEKEEKELAMAYTRLLYFNQLFNEYFNILDTKIIDMLAKKKKKEYYCPELNITLKLDNDGIVSVTEN